MLAVFDCERAMQKDSQAAAAERLRSELQDLERAKDAGMMRK